MEQKVWINTPKELVAILDNPISSDYIELFKSALGYQGENTKAHKHERAKCILIVGARGAGKTTITKVLQTYLPNMDLTKFGSFDGDILRFYYKPYNELMQASGNVIYKDAWDILKPHIDNAKNRILHDTVIPERRNIIVASSVEKTDYYYNLFMKNSYDVIVVGISVTSWDEVLRRGSKRAEMTGRPHCETKEMWEQCQLWIENISKRDEILSCIVIDNSDYSKPSIVFSNVK